MSINPQGLYYNSDIYRAHNAKGTAAHKAVSAEKMVETAAKPAPQAAAGGQKDEFSFWDLVDIINPLHHIPLVGTAYRELTGDKINNFGRIAGGALFGGFIGATMGGVNAIARNETGDDLGQMAMVKAGMREPSPLPAHKVAAEKPAADIPVIEVKALPKEQQLAAVSDEKATLDTIIWDAPSLLAKTQQKPVAVVAEKSVAPPVEAALQDAVVDSKKEVEPHIAAAMPDPKSLNDLEPGNPTSPMPPAMEHVVPAREKVPDTMMQALAKYQSMQRMGGENAVSAHEFQAASASPSSSRKFANLDRSIRRY